MKELRRMLVVENGNSYLSNNYGATNVAFDDTSPNTKVYVRSFQIVMPTKVGCL
jgi:hypothetical protein